ncbi:MAG: N-formylglutamate amidohydrolase, partial [Bdellovibrionales bacterium]|nr:N-formylglutamate amidohydrolase [Bdellovibrionales bacterium]
MKLPTAYFTHRRSEALRSPLVVSVPHAGLRVPELRKDLMMLREEIFLCDVDFEIHRMWQTAAETLDLSFIKCEVHRYAIDLNRRSDQRGEAKGLIWTQSTHGAPLTPDGSPFVLPPEADIQELIRDIWTPYYAFIQGELDRAREKFGWALLIDGHSMPSQGTSFHADPGGARADIVPGDHRGRACDARILQSTLAAAAAAQFSATPNSPYSGGNITQYFGQPQRHQHALQIEINRARYIENETGVPKRLNDAGLERLKVWAEQLLRELQRLQL